MSGATDKRRVRWRGVASAGAIVGLVLTVVGIVACTPAEPPEAAGISLAQALGDQSGDDRFARITGPPAFSFPEDHGPHPDYRQEWWYFTGHLDAENGRRFGYQVTFFRFALDREPRVEKGSHWHATQLYMAHLAVTEVDGRQFFAEERFARGAVGLAGAESAPLAVWVEDWRMDARVSAAEESVTGALGAGGDADPGLREPDVEPAQPPFSVSVDLDGKEAGVALTLAAARPPVPQGVEGYSRKGAAPGNASAYYSITRLTTNGTLRVGDQQYQVSGSSWFDREWGTSFLAPGVVGWDWFSLQLEDGRDLMFYRLRDDAGNSTPFSAGTLVLVDGADEGMRSERLDGSDVVLEPLQWWTSPDTGVRYPVVWKLELPAHDLALEVSASLPSQELDLAARYWEGAVEVSGKEGDRVVSGRGYLELAGY
jgi:predicted secreted hydrolase